MVTRRRPAAEPAAPASVPVRVLKKYPNRRLYDTQASAYVTLSDVKTMVLAGEAFEVRDAKTAEDLTRSILLQIILEEESAGAPMFSTDMLQQLIRFYGQALQAPMQDLMARNLQAVADMQKQFAMGGMAFSPEQWSQFLQGQAASLPAMQGLMGGYLEQSKALFQQMQEQMGKAGGFNPFGRK
jgi:polyhydroxyalkanoate synthesis repressor PhaR